MGMLILKLCENGDILTAMSYIKTFLTIIRIVVPLVLIISLMVGYTRAVKEKDDDLLSKANRLAVKKAIAAILVFLIPTFVRVLSGMAFFESNEYISCINEATKENIIVAYRNVAEKRIDEAKSIDEAESILFTATPYTKEECEGKDRYNDIAPMILKYTFTSSA